MRMPDQRFAGSRLKTASLHLCPALERQNVEAERLNKTNTTANLIVTFERCLLHHPAAEYFQFENPNAFLPPYLDIIGGRKEMGRHSLRNSFCNQKTHHNHTLQVGKRCGGKMEVGTFIISSCPPHHHSCPAELSVTCQSPTF